MPILKDNITVVTYANLNTNSGGKSDEAISIAKELYKNRRLDKLFCLNYSTGIIDIPDSYILTPPNKYTLKIINRLITYLSHISRLPERRYSEQTFDLFLSKNSRFLKSKTVLFLKPPFPKTVKQIKRLGAKTFCWATVFHPEFNYHQIIKQEKKYNIESCSDYSDQKRIQNLKDFYNAIDYIVVQSEIGLQTYMQYGINKKKLYLLKDTFGVDCDKYKPVNKKKDYKFRMLHISHMNLIKGLGYLFQAWKKLNLENAELILAGNADKNITILYERIKPPNTFFIGHIKNTTFHYNNSDVFVSPSVSDVQPSTVTEAMACGIPVIVSNMCGTSEMITHGLDGFVYQYDNIEELCYYIKWCYVNQCELTKMGNSARKKALQHKREFFSTRMIESIDRLASNFEGS